MKKYKIDLKGTGGTITKIVDASKLNVDKSFVRFYIGDEQVAWFGTRHVLSITITD